MGSWGEVSLYGYVESPSDPKYKWVSDPMCNDPFQFLKVPLRLQVLDIFFSFFPGHLKAKSGSTCLTRLKTPSFMTSFSCFPPLPPGASRTQLLPFPPDRRSRTGPVSRPTASGPSALPSRWSRRSRSRAPRVRVKHGEVFPLRNVEKRKRRAGFFCGFE